MTSSKKPAANRRNSSGPRTAAGKSIASRNAMRHGLTAVTHRQALPSEEVDRFAMALCKDAKDPTIFAQAVRIAENEFALRAIRGQQVVVFQRLQKSQQERIADERIFPTPLIAPAKDDNRTPSLSQVEGNLPDDCGYEGGSVPISARAPHEIRAKPDRTAKGSTVGEPDVSDTTNTTVLELLRLDRYAGRAWSRQKRAINQFMSLKLRRRYWENGDQ